MELEEIIREFLTEEFKEQGFHEGIRDNESLIEADIVDSLGILTIISFLEEKLIQRALQAGAVGYLLKSVNGEDLRRSIHYLGRDFP